MAQGKGESDLEYFGRRLRIMQDAGLKPTVADIMDALQPNDALDAPIDFAIDRIEAAVLRRQQRGQ